MRAAVRSTRFVVALALALFAAAPSGAREAEKEPLTGGLTPAIEAPATTAPAAKAAPAAPTAPAVSATPAESAAPAAVKPPPKRVKSVAAAKQGDDTSWGIVARGGYFGLPDALANKLFLQHPKIEGTMYGGEIRYHGAGGGRGVGSIGLAVDAGTARTDGIWQRKEKDPPKAASGDISLLAITVTGYWSLFPSWYVHPYIGIGVGAARLKGSYQNDNDLVEVDYWVPAVNLPLGLAVELGEHLQLAAEARFVDGISVNGAIQVRF